MTGWIILGAAVLLLILIGLVPVGVDLLWNADGFRLRLRIGFLSIRLGGREKAGTKADKKKPSKPASKGKKGLPDWPVLRSILRNGYSILCRLAAHVRIDVLKIHFTAAFSDPAQTAMIYGAAGMAMDALLWIGQARFKHPDLRAMVDFDRDTPLIDARICLTIRVVYLIGAGAVFGFGFWKDFRQRKKEAASHGKSSDR